MRSLAPLTGVLLLLTRLLAAALLLLTRLLLAWVLLARVLVLLARILVLIAHSNSPFLLRRGLTPSAKRGCARLRGNTRFLWASRGDGLSRFWRAELARGQQTLCKRASADPPQLPAPVPNC